MGEDEPRSQAPPLVRADEKYGGREPGTLSQLTYL